MMKKIKELIFAERGQAAVLVALSLTALLGFAAISVDYGYLANERRGLQNAADAAALAAAWELPDKGNVEAKGREYAIKNASELTGGQIKFAYPNELKEVKVDVEYTYDTFFGRVLGQNSAVISASATAEKISEWKGEALPFLNMGFDYSTTDPTAWTKVGPGINGTIVDFSTHGSGDDTYFEVSYADGIEITMGYANGTKGEDGSKLSDGLAHVINKKDMRVKKFYLFSLRDDIIRSKNVIVNGGVTKKINDLKNKDIIDKSQLVLIEVLFLDAKWANRHDLELEYLGKVFDLINDFPTEHLSSGGKSSRLVK